LLAAGFQRDTPGDWLAQYPRYVKALHNRVERLSGQYARDQGHTALLQSLGEPLWQALAQRDGLLLRSAAARDYRWMLEELRVSLFAQNLGTRKAVSKKRLEEQWRIVQQWLEQNPH
jgi:ATP-dependent helicase HrpA